MGSSIEPGSGSVVMATGIVSTSLAIEGQTAISRTLLGFAIAAWIVIAAVLSRRAVRDPARLRIEARSPGALTLTAATAVLGARFLVLGWPGPGAALLVVAVALWTVRIGVVLRALPDRTTGAAFMITVSTQSLAVLAAAQAVPDHAPLLEYLALPLAVAGLGLYPVALTRFPLGELRDGRGDHWITGGALAISALACAQITLTATRLHVLGSGGAVLQDLTLAVWAAAVAWLPALLIAEMRWPRLGYDRRRWATVFPLGMYAVCSYATGAAIRAPGVHDFARVWTWIALAAWLATALGLFRQLLEAPVRATGAPAR